MIVSAILALKGRDVATITPDRSIHEAVASLGVRKIGALVVTEGRDRIVGIISERDIVKAIAAGGAEVLAKPIAAIMTRDVVTCAESDTIDNLMARMTRGRFRHLPVVKGGKLAGIVSIGDVVKARIEEVEREAEDMRSYIATA
jgi:CBS domain-containing protein